MSLSLDLTKHNADSEWLEKSAVHLFAREMKFDMGKRESGRIQAASATRPVVGQNSNDIHLQGRSQEKGPFFSVIRHLFNLLSSFSPTTHHKRHIIYAT
jgi:hypothetical protein